MSIEPTWHAAAAPTDSGAHTRPNCSGGGFSDSEIASEIPVEFIARTLDHYLPSAVALKAATWNGHQLQCLMHNAPYPFTSGGHIDYMTAAMAMLYVSQASYLNARLLIRDNLVPPGIAVTDEEFFLSRDNGTQIFHRMETRFRRKILLDDDSFVVIQEMSNIRKLRRFILADFKCDMNQGACSVSGVFVMPGRIE